MTECEKRINTYLSPYWGNEDIMIATGCGKTEASKIKQLVVKNGGCVPSKGQKVFRDVTCKLLHIDIEKEIRLCRIAQEVSNV